MPTDNNNNSRASTTTANARWLYYAAAAATAIAGIMHLYLGPGSLRFSVNTGVFFIVAGIA